MLVSLIIPTYNEVENLSLLLAEIFKYWPKDIQAELIIVDDNSPDGTGVAAEGLAGKYPVRAIHRFGKLGLGAAVRAGFAEAKGEILGVMDADLSHDPAILPQMFSALSDKDIVIGSRFLPESLVDDWPRWRRLVSQVGVWFAGKIIRAPVADPLSGYFFLRRSVLDGVLLTAAGYKILFEILCKGNYASIKEIPFHFRKREHSTSKLNFKEHWLFLKQVVSYARITRG
ncbi:MAG: Dolichol-phosphate mannosyltransferase [Candidatus Kaiserbacteria bacterium GW2011_GWA2_49_19]|uniref:Dolichol-phosphate mannosyltransferase n=1 Tax=Candidatus Kaiserbacteria bacterium GW2011_GWA2_49_19 TaxID=1618669 RepID=A0A0G1Y324_9BACT|nr:MAG: Dolichol-phosphate mannosyltransferase [Candidatus Kaiserbacteria bacterium GW2011_GWA2_49_19]